ncbi:MAG: hypothetical protein ACK535_08520 [Cyanobacteriota bacterium]
MAQSYNGDQIGQGPCLIGGGNLLAKGGNWLLPEARVAEVWPASGEPRRIEQPAVLEAVAEFPGLQLELGELWAG